MVAPGFFAVGRYTETSEGDYLVSYLANLSRVAEVHDSKTAARGEQRDAEFVKMCYVCRRMCRSHCLVGCPREIDISS